MPSDTLLKSAWVERVLGVPVSSSKSNTSAPVAETPHPALAPRLRKARRDAIEALVAFGNKLLELPEVTTDPRADDVRDVIARFPGLIPPADEVLAALEDFDDAEDKPERDAASTVALKQIKAYAAQLAGVSELLALQRIAANGYGGLAACSRLSDTIEECSAGLGG